MFTLRGITNLKTIEETSLYNISHYCFDLRPKSLNFFQQYKIEEILEKYPKGLSYSLTFEDDKDFLVAELYKQVKGHLNEGSQLFVEFSSFKSPLKIDELKIPYHLYYQEGIRLSEISKSKYLKRLIFKHSYLETLHQDGELFSFLNLFKDAQGIHFELEIDWNTSLIESMFEYFTFHSLGLELNSHVELSYQNIDYNKLHNQMTYLNNLFS